LGVGGGGGGGGVGGISRFYVAGGIEEGKSTSPQ